MSARVATAALLLVAAFISRGEATPPPIELPAPELTVTVAPMPFGLTRPPLALPLPPPAPEPTIELGGPLLPRFFTTVAKPLPSSRDPGGFSCAFVAFRRAATLARCGIHRVLQNDLRGAREAFEESVAIDPRGAQAPEAYLWLGEVARLEGRYEQAERQYRTALSAYPTDELAAHAAVGLAVAVLRRGDIPEAQRALAQAQAHVPPQPVALIARFLDGVSRLLAGQPAPALAAWDGLAASGAPAAMVEELMFWRGVALARLGEPERGLGELDRFLATVPATHPLRADAIVQAGFIAFERGAAEEATRRFLLADGSAPRPELRPLLRAGLVRAYLALGDTGRATETARRLATDTPRDPLVASALLLIAEQAVRRGATPEALDVYRQLLGLPLAPAVADFATYRLGEGLERGGRPGEARGYYQQLRDRGRDEAVAQRAAYRLGLIALDEGDPASARREGEALLRAGPLGELREGITLLAAEGAARGGDPNRAATLFRLALRERPGSPRVAQVRVALGWALLGDREPENALREWQAVTGAADLEAARRAWLAIADVALRQGHEAQALEALRALRGATLVPPLGDLVALNHGILAVRARAYQEAVQMLEPLGDRLADVSRQALLRRALGIARYHLGQYDLAERQFRQAAHVAPAEPSAWLGAGLAALAHGRFVEADEALNRGRLGAVPEVAGAASYGLVLVAFRRGDAAAFRDRATFFVDRYTSHAATPALIYALATTALDHGELRQTEGWVRRLLREHPTSPHVDEALRRFAVAPTQRPAVARQAYRDLLARRPTPELRAEALLGAAEMALVLGDGADAQQGYEAFLREVPPSDPRAARAQAALVQAHLLQGQRDRAIRATDAYLRQFGNTSAAPEIQLTRGQLLLEARQWEAAQRALEAARDAGEAPVAAPAQFWLGEALRARDEHEAAVAAYLGATYLYPGTPWAARGLQGAAESYLKRNMRREAAIVLRKLAAAPGTEPALAQWARQVLTQLGPVPEDPAPVPAPDALPKR